MSNQSENLSPEAGSDGSADVARRVRIVEVGPRDGLQNQPVILAAEDKAQFVDLLAQSGLMDIEVTSFVSPARVPQLADGEAVFALLARRPGVRYTALVANDRGLDRAVAAGVDGIALFTAASEAFAMRNIGKTINESLIVFRALTERAHAGGLWVRAYVSTAFTCPFTGPITPAAVRPIVSDLIAMGVEEVSIGDTIGAARPGDVALLTEDLLNVLPLGQFAYHFHDTLGRAVDNVNAALEFGVSIFDSSAGGIGGCPFAPGAPGNLATETLIALLTKKGLQCGVDIDKVRYAAEMLRARLASVDNP